MNASRFVAIVIGDNFTDSRWASDEMKQALARERRENKMVVVPLLVGSIPLPTFIEDKLYIDFRSDYFAGVVRLAGLVNDVPRQHIEEAIRITQPQSLRGCIVALRDAGFKPYVVMSKEDATAILQLGGVPQGKDRIRFSPRDIEPNPKISPRLRRMMRRLLDEYW